MIYDIDDAAWQDLVDRYEPRMWAIARGLGLNAADAADAVQGSWLRLVESLHTIRDPARIGGWLCVTVRHEAIRIGRARSGARAAVELPPELPGPDDDDPAWEVVTVETGRALWRAVDALPEPCRTLLRLLTTFPEAGYAAVARRMNLPIGSIGPTRGRCLRRLRPLLADAIGEE